MNIRFQIISILTICLLSCSKSESPRSSPTLSSEYKIISFKLNSNNQTFDGVINHLDGTIFVDVVDVDLSIPLTPIIQISSNATISPSISSPQNFSSDVQYTVIAENGGSKLYTISVSNTNTSGITTDVSLIIQVNSNELHQVDIDNGNEITTTNLSELYNAPYQYDRMIKRDYYPYFTLFKYTGVGAGYSAWEKDLTSDMVYSVNTFCDLDTEETTIYPYSTKDYLVVGTREFISDMFLNLRIFNKSTGACTKLPIGYATHIEEYRPATFNENLLLIYYIDNLNQNKLVKIDLENAVILDELIIDDFIRASLDNNKLHIFKGNTINFYHVVYNFDTFVEESSNLLEYNFQVGSGIIETNFENNKMAAYSSYAQPFDVSDYPIIIDFNTNTIKRADYFQTHNNLTTMFPSGTIVNLMSLFKVDIENELIIGGFITYDGNEYNYGVVYTNFEGEVFSYTMLDDWLLEIIIR